MTVTVSSRWIRLWRVEYVDQTSDDLGGWVRTEVDVVVIVIQRFGFEELTSRLADPSRSCLANSGVGHLTIRGELGEGLPVRGPNAQPVDARLLVLVLGRLEHLLELLQEAASYDYGVVLQRWNHGPHAVGASVRSWGAT